jgi:hypothetical protein
MLTKVFKAKPTKHTAAEIAAKTHAATTNVRHHFLDAETFFGFLFIFHFRWAEVAQDYKTEWAAKLATSSPTPSRFSRRLQSIAVLCFVCLPFESSYRPSIPAPSANRCSCNLPLFLSPTPSTPASPLFPHLKTQQQAPDLKSMEQHHDSKVHNVPPTPQAPWSSVLRSALESLRV